MFGKKKITKPVYPSDVAPSSKVNHYKETYSQSMMNYEIIREKVQTQFQPKGPAPAKAKAAPKKLLNF